MSTAMHLNREQLEAGLDAIGQSPKEQGTLELIVRRPETLLRDIVQEGELDLEVGLVGDNWKTRGGTERRRRAAVVCLAAGDGDASPAASRSRPVGVHCVFGGPADVLAGVARPPEVVLAERFGATIEATLSAKSTHLLLPPALPLSRLPLARAVRCFAARDACARKRLMRSGTAIPTTAKELWSQKPRTLKCCRLRKKPLSASYRSWRTCSTSRSRTPPRFRPISFPP